MWDREVLSKQVWAEPIRQLAKKYGVSDVAIHNRCKKMGVKLPGRGYWAKQANQTESCGDRRGVPRGNSSAQTRQEASSNLE
jgi:Zn-dependent peptidase ImmA (M78 family)